LRRLASCVRAGQIEERADKSNPESRFGIGASKPAIRQEALALAGEACSEVR